MHGETGRLFAAFLLRLRLIPELVDLALFFIKIDLKKEKDRMEEMSSRPLMEESNGPARPPPPPAAAVCKRAKESWGGDTVKSIVYAGLDAIVTCFSLISSISGGARLSSVDVLVIGVANLVADGISMGFGDFLSSGTEMDMATRDKAATRCEMMSDAESQQLEMQESFRKLGMNPEDARIVVSIFSKYNDIMVNEKMMEKGMLQPNQSEKPWKRGLTTFVAFLIFGSMPLLSFIILIPFATSQTVKVACACVLSALALAFLGLAKARIAGQNYALSALTTITNGAVAATAAYLIGWILRNVAGLHD
ncbi:hypothetical protein ACLOJK_006128 [Asimina triloba]